MAICGKCKTEIEWVKVDGKWGCHNFGTTIDHWDLCSQLRTKQIIDTGKYFEDKQDKGYITNLKKSGVQYMQRNAKVKKGKKYIETIHSSDCVPWEECICQ